MEKQRWNVHKSKTRRLSTACDNNGTNSRTSLLQLSAECCCLTLEAIRCSHPLIEKPCWNYHTGHCWLIQDCDGQVAIWVDLVHFAVVPLFHFLLPDLHTLALLARCMSCTLHWVHAAKKPGQLLLHFGRVALVRGILCSNHTSPCAAH